MIQPLDTARNIWRLLLLEIDEPVPTPSRGELPVSAAYYLPTCLLVTNSSGKPLCPPELLEELDQDRAEQLLGRLFEEHGPPHRLTIAESDDWDTEAWGEFAQDYRIEIAFGSFPQAKPGELQQVGRRIAQRLRGDGFHAPSAVALGLVATAKKLRSPGKRNAHLRKAVEQDSECVSARIELADADYQSGKWDESSRGYREVIEREERRWRGETPSWWEDHDTRPFLRAIYGRAMTEWHRGRFSETARDLQRLLALNPRDNQGTRFLLPMVHLLGEDDAQSLKSFSHHELHYPGDYVEPSLLFGKGLALWRAGDEQRAREAYRNGMLKNLHIAPLLLDLPSPPPDLWHPNDRSEPGYAQDFMQSYALLWDRDPSALRFLREVHTELAPCIDLVTELRRKMADWQDQRYDRDYKERWKEMTELDESLTGGTER
jgi:tetratricopeptide (TPR) repeat protein